MIPLYCGWNYLSKHKPIYETLESSGIIEISYWTFVIISIFLAVIAVIIAFNCNPNNKLAYGFVAFMFSGIYLIQFAVRKYLLKEKGYCKVF